VQTKTEQLEKTVRVAEREYSKKMAELSKSFDVSSYAVTLFALFMFEQAVGNTFSGMEERINVVSSTAIRIGWYFLNIFIGVVLTNLRRPTGNGPYRKTKSSGRV
jgi:hypothetical protein